MTSSGVWQAFPVSGSSYISEIPNNFFAVNTATGVITYSGPTGQRVLIMASLGIVPGGAIGTSIEMDLSIGGSLIGGSTQSTQSVSYSVGTSNQLMQLQQNFMLQLTHNQTYQHVILGSGTPANLSFLRYQTKIINLG